MQIPYIIVKNSANLDKRAEVGLPGRKRCEYETNNFTYLFFPPNNLDDDSLFTDRVYLEDDRFYYEDGFMVKYPQKYIRKAAEKLDLFELTSTDLDGFYSRIVEKNGEISIDGSALYLQMMFSYCVDGDVVYSNNYELMVDFLKANNVTLEFNDEFFANHMLNYSLAYFMSAGTLYKNIEFHDSLETIRICENVESTLYNKFKFEDLSEMSRDDRLNLLHKRISHVIEEYCSYIDVEELGHNLTGGKDSRVSLGLFMQTQKEKLVIATGGFAYTQDKIISSYVCDKYNLKEKEEVAGLNKSYYDYENSMEFPNPSEAFIPLFRKIAIQTRFEKKRFIASGYLGNVLTFSGTEKNQIMRKNPYHIESSVFETIVSGYDNAIEKLKSTYGEDCYAMFNIMYNTTNKLASICRRLKMQTFCIFELDILQACYLMESPENKKGSSLHYELLKRANPELLHIVPFEHNKSFDSMDDTYELTGFKLAGRPGLHHRFVKENIRNIIDHLKEHFNSLSFLDVAFIEKVEQTDPAVIPAQMVNKIFAALGTLELKGIKFENHHVDKDEETGSIYSTGLFKEMLLEGEVYASGLATMVYQKKIVFKTYIELSEHERFNVRVVSVSNPASVEPDIDKVDDGFMVSMEIPSSGKYNIIISLKNTETKVYKELYSKKIVARLNNQMEEETELDGERASGLAA